MNAENNEIIQEIDKFLEEQRKQNPSSFAKAESLVEEAFAEPLSKEITEYSDLPGLTLPLDEYEQQRFEETMRRVFESKQQNYKTLQEAYDYYQKHGNTGGENYLTAMHNLAAELIERRRQLGKV
ncbi:MAG: hypothetical protein HC820_01430 [Hydrococcus sp. RM1_1_31]|nr:hypothetical protein [Hydrococcus sp. RM1_1_31]